MTKTERITELELAIRSAIPLIALAENERCFVDCALPLVGKRTLVTLEAIVSPASLAQEFSQ